MSVCLPPSESIKFEKECRKLGVVKSVKNMGDTRGINDFEMIPGSSNSKTTGGAQKPSQKMNAPTSQLPSRDQTIYPEDIYTCHETSVYMTFVIENVALHDRPLGACDAIGFFDSEGHYYGGFLCDVNFHGNDHPYIVRVYGMDPSQCSPASPKPGIASSSHFTTFPSRLKRLTDRSIGEYCDDVTIILHPPSL